MLYCDVILPLPIPNAYTYAIPSEYAEQIAVGMRAVVQFGAKKVLTAVILRLHDDQPAVYEPRPILSLADDIPSVLPIQLDFYQKLADYYLCHRGEVLNAALPSGLKLSSESKIQLNPAFKLQFADTKSFTPKELSLLEYLEERESVTYGEASSFLEVKNIYNYLNSLQKKNAIVIFEELKEKYKPKIIKKIRLADKYARDEASLQFLIEQLEKKPKQLDVVLGFLQKSQLFQSQSADNEGILKSELLEDESISDSSLKSLIKSGVFDEVEVIISRIDEVGPSPEHNFELSNSQQKAKTEIINHFESKNTVLLHGITGSGKTEIYIELIKNILENGQQVLFLLPEIALTTQIVGRLSRVFGDILGIYHSKYSDNERVEVWKGLMNGRFKVIVGVRSSIFLPFSDLGLIIVDEEHEPSYKQYDPAPRYHARDAALMLAQLHFSKVLLGSATPSIESYHMTKEGKWGLVILAERFANAKLPEIALVDMKIQKQQKKLKHEFSEPLSELIISNLQSKKQTILFQNRRGYSPYVSCEDCGFVPQCKSCDVSLTYHLHRKELSCHYCGHKEPVLNICPACGSNKIRTVGFGTEKLEEEAQILFPEARIQRMDLDTTRSKTGYSKIIQAVENEEVDVLVGTQMVTKGLDFDHVNLVGVFDIDRMLHFPDFRSHERVFQILTQVSGRAGRKSGQGRVVIQTSQPGHPIFSYVLQADYQGFYEKEIVERKKYLYPPFSRMIRLTLKHTDRSLIEKAALVLVANLRKKLGDSRILGPQSPVIDKIRDRYLKDINVKLEKDKIDIKKSKLVLMSEIQYFNALPEFKQVEVVVDVDFV